MAHSIYGALKHNDSIRVFRLHAGTFDSELQGELEEVRLKDRPSYEALSYVWGDARSSDTISMDHNQTKVNITPSLALALRYFRLEDVTRTLWVDALCINQDESNPEKGHQVGLMDRMYKSASTVLIWLGRDSKATAAIFEYFRAMAACAARFIGYDIESGWTTEYPLSMDLNEQDLEELRELANLGWRLGMAEILSKAWFQRLWVVQEVSLAQRAIVFCGTYSVPWKHVAETVHLLRAAAEKWPVSRAATDLIYRTGSLVRVRCEFIGRQREHDIPTTPFRVSIRLFDMVSDQKCKDDRDRVYALMALLEPRETLLLEPNYRLSVNQTYKMFARAVLRRQGIIILSYAGLCCRPWSMQLPSTEKDYLPSWAPDFRKDVTIQTSLPMHKGAMSAFIRKMQVQEVRLNSNENILEVLGFELDEVMICEEVPKFRGLEGIKEMRSLILKFEQVYHKFSRKGLFKPDNKDLVFAVTLVPMRDDFDGRQGWQAYYHHILRDYETWSDTHFSMHSNVKSKLLCAGKDSDFLLALQFHDLLCRTIGGLKLFLTKCGFLGVGPMLVKPGDIFAPISVDTRPYIIRRTSLTINSGESSVFQLIGECHVYPFGLMVGMIAMAYQFPWTWIALI